MNAWEGIKRLLMLVVVVAGFSISYAIQGNPFVRGDVFASFVGLGALIAIALWWPVRYILKGFNPKA